MELLELLKRKQKTIGSDRDISNEIETIALKYPELKITSLEVETQTERLHYTLEKYPRTIILGYITTVYYER